ncbi:MAG: hypothetical protein LBJ32_02170 [Oscillospiraceae bacterium]|jgi:hypothetical protein|nr:hypothetical protein [Oscillospiraceae bacterium]
MKKEIEKEINKKERFIFNREEIEIFFREKRALEKEIKKTLEDGTIIAMHVDVRTGNVFLGSSEVAYFCRTSINKGKKIHTKVNGDDIVKSAMEKLDKTISELTLLL